MKEMSNSNTQDVQTIVEERISKTIVGRSCETEMFNKQFDRVLEGGTGLTIVSGQPGIGKTFFVEHATGLLGSATYVHGKFRQYDKSPLIAFAEVIEQTVRHILTLPAESLKNIKSELNKKLGADLSIILSVCPYAQILLGTHKAVDADSLEQLKYRVRKAVYQFLATVSTALFPLIVFLDDLQWADSLSVHIIETICQDYGFLNLHLVLAWRDDDPGRVRLNPAKLPNSDDIAIELSGLNLEGIDEYIRLIFEQNIEHKDYLIRILCGLTLGNPFNISRILKLFLRAGVLVFPPANEKWLLRLDKMDKLNLPADVEKLLARQINGLEREDKELLCLIACCGDVIFPLLKILTGMDEALLNAGLERLCENSLLVKIIQDDRPRDEEVRYGFAHDIVLKLAYSNLESSEKSKIHYHVAETLSELKDRTSATDGRLDIAAHLLKADMSLLRQGKTEKWINELYKAGITARQVAAAEQAMEIFERCAGLLSGCEPAGKNGLALDVLLELSECRFIYGKTEEAKRGFEKLLSEYPETENQIRINRKYINLCAFSGDYEKVMELGIQILVCLNFKLDPKYLIPDLIESRLLFSDRKIERLKTAPVITDERLLCILEILALMVPSAKRVSDKMPAMIALRLAILSARHGNSLYAPVAYASYCYVLLHILKDHKKGKQLEDVTLALIESCESSASKYVALCIIGSLTHHWTNPLADTAGYLEQALEEGEKEGSSLYESFAITFAIATKYMMGTPLEELTQYITDCREKQKRLEHYLASFIYDSFLNHIRWLKEGARSEEKAFPKEYRYKTMYADVIEMNDDMITLQQLYLEGQTEKAWRLAEDIAPRINPHPEYVIDAEFLFYSVLARIAWHQNLTGPEKRRNKKLMNTQLKELKRWVSVYPGNHRARYLLAQAEYDALFAPEKASDKPYREAMDFAEEQGNLPLEALANLLAAKFHRDNPRLSRFYAAEAASLYQKWGAAYIGGLVAQNIGLPYEAACSAEKPFLQAGADEADDETKAARDILFHLDKIEKMHEDEGYLYLLDVLIRQENADYCAVFFEKDDEMVLKYESRKDAEACAHRDMINMNHLSGLPHKVIRYAARTETDILLDKKAPIDSIFSNDPCLADKAGFSLACLPVRYSGIFIGIIYLEKKGEDGFGSSLLSFVKGFVPALLSKKAIIREANVQSISNPQNENSLFTARELEVLKLVAEGMSNSEISKKLYITLGTVSNHLHNIFAKLEVDNRVKAVMRSKELKIIQI